MLQIGRFSFTNTLPLLMGWDVAPPSFCHSFTIGSPAQLCELIEEKALDFSLISSVAYLRNQDELKPVGDYCIAAKNQALSVILFSRYHPKKLHKKNIFLSSQSRSSSMLLQVLCHQIWKIDPFYFFDHHQNEDMDAYLVIGDQALLQKPLPGYTSYDLTSLWHEETFLPFVFGLFVGRCDTEPEKFIKVKTALDKSYLWGKSHKDRIITQALKALPLPSIFLKRYFNHLHYRLQPEDRRSLELFRSLSCPELFPHFIPEPLAL